MHAVQIFYPDVTEGSYGGVRLYGCPLEGNELWDMCSGKTVAIFFTASWCKPCTAFMPKLKEFATRNSVPVIVAGLNNPLTQAAAFREYATEVWCSDVRMHVASKHWACVRM